MGRKSGSHRCRSAFHTHSANRRLISGSERSPLTKKRRRSQSTSPGHLPSHGWRRGSFASNPTHPNACPPQCGQRSTSQPSLCFSPTWAPQSGQFFIVLAPVACRPVLVRERQAENQRQSFETATSRIQVQLNAANGTKLGAGGLNGPNPRTVWRPSLWWRSLRISSSSLAMFAAMRVPPSRVSRLMFARRSAFLISFSRPAANLIFWEKLEGGRDRAWWFSFAFLPSSGALQSVQYLARPRAPACRSSCQNGATGGFGNGAA